jgi:hypothetical protein
MCCDMPISASADKPIILVSSTTTTDDAAPAARHLCMLPQASWVRQEAAHVCWLQGCTLLLQGVPGAALEDRGAQEGMQEACWYCWSSGGAEKWNGFLLVWMTLVALPAKMPWWL